MKKEITLALLTILSLGSCTKLDVDVKSQFTKDNFPTTQDAFLAATGTIYPKFNRNYPTDIFRLTELTGDEAIMPSRNVGYYDNGIYMVMHKHTWDIADPTVKGGWNWGYEGISDCNRVLNLLENSPESSFKSASVAEVRTMRALFYFYMMDLFGNVPITTFGVKENPSQSTRAEVFKFIETELQAVVGDLAAPATVTQKYYGRPTKWMVYAILQKMYLNAQVYLGKPMYQESIDNADKIIKEGGFSLVGNYNDLFSPTNGPNTETIFPAIYDVDYSPGNNFTRFTLHSSLKGKYKLSYSPSNVLCTLPEFLSTFNLKDDVRNATWLFGLQFENDGKTPVKTGNFQLNLTPEIVLTDIPTMDVGPEIGGVSRGARSIKFFPDERTNSAARFGGNDIPVFRLADIYLMKAEALLRQGGDAAEALRLFNLVRLRAKAPELKTALTLEDIFLERGRELAWECWRRNDLIRFGKYENAWGFKVGNEGLHRRLFPIPATEIVLNNKLNQNPGY